MYRGPSFFKVILSLPQFSTQLRIPPQFVKHIDKEAFERATLRGPSGCCWSVKLHKDKNDIYLIDGWRSFFEAHSLKDYEILVFNYEGKMLFDVTIFGRNGLERKANVPEIDGSQSLQHDSENETENVGKGTSNAKRKRGRPRKRPLVDGSGHETGEEDEFFQEIRKFRSKFPFFEQLMDRKKLKRADFYIPSYFSQKHLRIGEMKTKMILRNEKGNLWEVTVHPYRKGAYFGEGWTFFSKENKLKAGDRCIFQLVKKTEMQVHIFRSTISKNGAF